jgi:hypothetical protein
MRILRTVRPRRETREERIDRHYEASTCWLCEGPVLDGQARYNITGAHYDCHTAEYGEFKRLTVERINDIDISLSSDPRIARANGGGLTHFVVPRTRITLCGHKPKDKAHHMRTRGKWLYLKEPTHKFCEKCAQAMGARGI